MSPAPVQPEGELIPPTPDYATAAPSSRQPRTLSVWDPRSAPGTYSLLAINIAVYLWMIGHGVNAKLPSDTALIHYGANNTWLVLHGQWYRLLTATFVHVGLLHLASNMWCLWNLGILGEPLVGPVGMIATYLLTGIAGNLLSMAVNVAFTHLYRDPRYLLEVGAGASGAVFGIAGILIVLLSNRRLPIPWSELRRLRSSVVQFSLINLAIGLSTLKFNFGVRIDNSAHIGGFLCGLALGPPLVPRMTAGRDRYLKRQQATFTAACFLLALFGYWVANLL
jgi:rhomboid protease GluP